MRDEYELRDGEGVSYVFKPKDQKEIIVSITSWHSHLIGVSDRGEIYVMQSGFNTDPVWRRWGSHHNSDDPADFLNGINRGVTR